MRQQRTLASGWVIDVGLPAPEGNSRGREARFPFADMEVGESVLIPKAYATRADITWACCHLRRRRGMQFVRKATTAGVRVWRVE